MSDQVPTAGSPHPSPLPEEEGGVRPEGEVAPELVEGADEGVPHPSPLPEGEGALAPRPPRAHDWRQTGLALLVLLSGIVIGACGAVIIGKQMLVSSVARGPDNMPGEVVDRIALDLRLSPEQVAQVHDVIGRRMRRVDEIRANHLRDVAEQFDLMRDEVAQVLPPEQARMWGHRFDEARRLGFAAPPHPGAWPPQGPAPPGGALPGRGGPPRGPTPEGKTPGLPPQGGPRR